MWICHFSKLEIQNLLPLWHKASEFAPWISNAIEGFEKRNDVELHIVAPHSYLKRDTSFKLRGVYYYFLTYGFPIINRPWPSFFALDIKTGYFRLTNKIVKKVTQVNPDVVNLQGAENAYYSSSILRLKQKFPCIITIQGFASHIQDKKSEINKVRIFIEGKILRGFKYFFLDNDAVEIVKRYSPDMKSKVVWWPAAESIIDSIKDVPYSEKIYDILYAGRIERSKGIEDFIKIVGILKVDNPNIRACIIGSSMSKYLTYLKRMALDLNCLENINFVGFVETQAEMFVYFKSSKLLLVPTLIDRYPSTIREAMRSNLPVLAYKTGNIPWTNTKGENIILIEYANFTQMAQKAKALLKEEKLLEKTAKAGREFYEIEFSLKKNVERFIEGYNEVINEFKKR